jgi:hypothetical protein
MLFRQFAIVVLAILAPLAFVAWVLPNTEKFFKMWWENLLKAIMMFPLITGMLALALFLSQASAFVFGDNQVADFLGAIFPLIALILVPKTFKWSGQLMAVTGGAVAGYLSGKASEKYKASAKEGGIAKTKGAAYMKAGNALPSSFGGASLAKKGALLRGAAEAKTKEGYGKVAEDDLISLVAHGGKDKRTEAAANQLKIRYAEHAKNQATWYHETQTTNPFYEARMEKIAPVLNKREMRYPPFTYTKHNPQTGLPLDAPGGVPPGGVPPGGVPPGGP